jgi:hypothetical protein
MAAITTAVLATAAVVGVGLTAYGMYEQTQAAQTNYAAQQQATAAEQRNEAVRRRAMEFDAKRRQLEAIRNMQRARSVALANATNQGAGQGSGLQGGFGQISGQTGDVIEGIRGNLAFGRETFGNNIDLSNARLAMAAAGTQASFGAGLSSLGGSIISSLPAISGLSGGFRSAPNQVATSSTSFGY